MSEKRGRPRKATARREKNIGFFVTQAQFLVIQRKAERAMVNVSDYMRQVAIDGEVRARWTDEEREMVKKLIGMSADLHRLAESSRAADNGETGAGGEEHGARAGAADNGPGSDIFKQLRDDLDLVIKQLCHDR